MVTTIQGNILEVESGIICHQVNSRGVAGAGLALQIRNKWPDWYSQYQRNTIPRLGVVHWYEVKSLHNRAVLSIASLYAQENYGTKIRQTNYAYLAKCLLAVEAQSCGEQIYIPHGIGCGLGGGDWQIVYRIIEDALPHAVIVKFTQPNHASTQTGAIAPEGQR
jgi:O-acetyl-ADP-ribose deacetylase (regulator of RNase III)